jgi:DNA-binding NarL/FixJ family response regulator
MSIIKVALIEDQEDINLGLKYMIGNTEGFDCISFTDAESALKTISKSLVDVVLMDINLPGIDGIECTKLLKQKFPELQIMMCTVYEDDQKIFNAISAGASGYILKRSDPSKIIEAIKDLINGGSPMSSQIARKVITLLQAKNSLSLKNTILSDREKEVLDLIALGYRNKQVADKLFISISTVKTHVHNIYEKLHVSSRIEAVKKINY